MNHLKNAFAIVKNNRTAITQKTVVAAGAAAGMLITSTLVDRLGRRNSLSTDLHVIDLDEGFTTKDTESPTE